MSSAAPEQAGVKRTSRLNYLTADYGIRSWLLATDHKRIALLYLVSITLFFILGGLFAVLIRLELLTPQGDLMQAETYNRMFTMHGVMMIFFFLIPSIPAVLGNFLIPIMIGAKGPCLPEGESAQLVHLHHRGGPCVVGHGGRRRRHRMDFLHALQQ